MLAILHSAPAQAETLVSQQVTTEDGSRAQKFDFQIAPQPLATALVQFGEQSGAQVSASDTLIAGLDTLGVRGVRSPRAALAQLLSGSGLTFRVSGTGAFILTELSSPDGGQSTIEIGAVRVEGITPGEVTEQTGSYTTGWMRSATGIALSPKETPQSVSVVTRQQIEDRNLNDIRSVAEQTTGVTVSQGETERLNFFSRGFEIQSFQYDGVPTNIISFNQYGDGVIDTVIYDHIEVVRGAAGLMIGAGEPSGSINLIRKRPTDEFQASVTGLIGTENNYRGEVDIAAPIAVDGKVRARLVGAAQSREDTLDLYEQDKHIIYGTIEADLTESTLFVVGAHRQRTQPKGTTWGGLPAFGSDGNLVDWPKGATTGTKWTGWDTTSLGAFMSLEHTFGNGWNARAAYDYLQNDFDASLLFVYGNPDPDTGNLVGAGTVPSKKFGDRDQHAIALSLNGDFDFLGFYNEFVFGSMASRATSDVTRWWSDGSDPAPVSLLDWSGDYPEPDWIENNDDISRERFQQAGAFVSLRSELTDKLALVSGIRLNHWDGQRISTFGNFDYTYDGVVTPYVGLTYDFNDAVSLYGSYTNIYKPQPFIDENGDVLDPAYGHNYEVGLKSSFFRDRLNASVAVFQTNQTDVGEFVRADPVTLRDIYRVIDGTTTRGVEFEVAGMISPDWNVFAGFTHRRAEDENGVTIFRTRPENLLKASTTYRLPGALDDLTIGGGLRWQSETSGNAYFGNEQRDIVQNSYAVLDLLAIYDITDDVNLTLNVYNVADERYYRAMGAFDSVHYGEGRTATLALRIDF